MIADLCLVLLLDASGSVDAAEWELQAKATAAAISSPAIVDKIVHGAHGRIAVTALEWATGTNVAAPWAIVASLEDAQAFGLALAGYERKQSGSTAIGDALRAAQAALAIVPADCVRQVVDISGDGAANAGGDPGSVVLDLMAHDVQVNAIVIEDEPGVLEFYEKTVNGFALPATWDNYAQAIKMKLMLEISAAW